MHSAEEIIQDRDQLYTELARRELIHFVKQSWHVIEPATEFKNNWHIGAVCEHVQAVKDGEIRNLLVNMPPRFLKSIVISVALPAWSWIDSPEFRWLYSSYSYGLSVRDAVKTRRILQSNWYRNRWGDKFKLTSDQNTKERYENDKLGYRITTSVNGGATGEGGDILVADDPHNIIEIESEAFRKNVITWWSEVMPSRLNDPMSGGKIVVMQRSHQHDLSGWILDTLDDYEHLMIPNEFDPARRVYTSIGFTDPREKAGELLAPNRVDKETTKNLKKALGTHGYAGQYQQTPSARGGNLFAVEELNLVKRIKESNIKKRWRSWDKAATQDGGDYTVGLRMGKYKKPRLNGTFDEDGEERCSIYFIDDVVRGQWSPAKREKRIVKTSNKDGKKVSILVEQEGGSGGKESAEATEKRLKNRKVVLEKPSGKKEDRADDFAVAIENGEVDILDNQDWTEDLIDEYRHFPASKNDDQVDAGSGAFNKLQVKGRVHIG